MRRAHEDADARGVDVGHLSEVDDELAAAGLGELGVDRLPELVGAGDVNLPRNVHAALRPLD